MVVAARGSGKSRNAQWNGMEKPDRPNPSKRLRGAETDPFTLGVHAMFQQRGFRPLLERLEDRCVPAIITVTKLDDSAALPGMNLREAVTAANATAAADTIVFKKGLEGTIILDGTEIPITSNLTINGPGASKLAVSGNFTSRIFNIDGGAG